MTRHTAIAIRIRGTCPYTQNTYALANVTKARDNGNFASKHDIGGTLDTIHEGLATSIVVVELGLGNRVIDVDSRNLELALTESLVEVVDTGSSLFRKTSDIWIARQIYQLPLITKIFTLQELGVFFVNDGSEITTVVQDHVETLAIWESRKSLFNTPIVLLLCLTLPGKDGNTCRGDAADNRLYAIKTTV